MRTSYRERLGVALMAGLLAVSVLGGTTPASASQPAAVTLQRAEPIMVASGQFGEIDLIHKGAGTATVWQLPDGARVLRFEDFRVTNGPDLYVYRATPPPGTAASSRRARPSRSPGSRAMSATRTTSCRPTWTSPDSARS